MKTFSKRFVKVISNPVRFRLGDDIYSAVCDLEIIDEDRYGNWLVGNADSIPGDFFDLRNGDISYHHKPENQKVNENGKWSQEGRDLIRIGKLLPHLNPIFSHNYSNSYVNDSSVLTKLVTKYTEILTASVLSGKIADPIQISDDPSTIYTLPICSSIDIGTLRSSCMRQSSSFDCHKGYKKYTEWGLKIVYVERDGALCARALLWEDIKLSNGERGTFVDRIYGSENMIEYFILWAESKGYYHKVEQDSKSKIITNGKILTAAESTEALPWKKVGFQPYMDTFVFIRENTFYAKMPNEDSEEFRGKRVFNLQSTCSCFGYVCATCGTEIGTHNSICYCDDFYCQNCVRLSDWNQSYVPINELIPYYNARGGIGQVDRNDTSGLVTIFNGWLCEPL